MKVLLVKLNSCGVNYQSDYLLDVIPKNFELTKDLSEAESIVIIGGCCCTDELLNNTINGINYILNNKKNDSKTYLIGCITRGFKNNFKLQQIEIELKQKIDFFIDHYEPNTLLKLLNKQKFEENTDSFYGAYVYDKKQSDIYVQNGCNHSCTFCKSNYLNCNLKDIPLEKVKEYIDKLNDKKVNTIQLRGLNLSLYGLDLYKQYKLMEICEYIEEKSNIKHVILSGIAFSDAIKMNFSDKLKDLKKVDLINGSLESGSNRILNLMKKGFTQEEFLKFYEEVNSIYKKQFYLNIISGFPTETINDCKKTIETLKFIKPKLVNINTYVDSEFILSHSLEQLTDLQINKHTKIYTKELKKNRIKFKINGAN